MKKIGLGLLLLLVALGLGIYLNPQINPSHTTPYLALVAEQQAPAPAEREVLQRVILYGDAGHSSIEPWQESLAMIAQRASIAPEKTAVIALGDNIYYSGYPQREPGQQDFDEDQRESISYLDAQLNIARVSGASLYLVPGNHDWYASELEGQGQHIAAYAREHNVNVSLQPWESGKEPMPSAVDLPGVSLVFLDSEWMMHSSGEQYAQAMAALAAEIARIREQYPEQLILVNAHHPMETMGPHAGYLTNFGYWFFIKIIYLIYDIDQDVDHPSYAKFIENLDKVFSQSKRIIYAAGHEHSLQVFASADARAPEYKLVSGAGNTSKVSGVWHNDNTRFALSQEGFMELQVTANGVHLSIYDIHHPQAVAQFWLDLPPL